jgi:hypothetical protein
MTAICATCKHWAIKTSSQKAAEMAPCALQARCTALRPDHSCARHSPLEPVLFAKREAWLKKLIEKYKGMK